MRYDFCIKPMTPICYEGGPCFIDVFFLYLFLYTGVQHDSYVRWCFVYLFTYTGVQHDSYVR